MQTDFAMVQNILLIEDKQVDTALLSHKLSELKEHGLSFEQCATIDDGLRRLKKGDIDVILLDLSVSRRVDNVEKLYEKVPWIPIIVLTKSNDTDTGMKSLTCGAQDYLSTDELDLHCLCRAMNYAIARKQKIESHDGFTKVRRDITERMLAQQEIAEAKMRLSLALEAAAIGVFDLDLARNSAWRSLRHDEIFGHAQLLPEWNFDIFATYIVPEDLPSAKEAFLLGVEHSSFRMQCKIIRADDNAVRWISVRGEILRNDQGVPIRMMGTVADITDINEKQEQKRLLAIMKEREDFMATLTHDMKNPLIGANQLLKMFVDGSFGEMTKQQHEMLQCLKETNSGLLKLIADLIDVYRFEKDADFLWTADCDLVNLVSSCVHRISPFAKIRSIDVTTQMPDTMAALVDVSKLERVVQNLLDNALKFAPKGGSIGVKLLGSEASTVIEIEDNGPGIEADEQPRLFQRFAQGTVGKRYSGGSGLGLYLCKQIIEAHGGTIACTSQPHSSTIFRITLPKANNV